MDPQWILDPVFILPRRLSAPDPVRHVFTLCGAVVCLREARDWQFCLPLRRVRVLRVFAVVTLCVQCLL